VALKGHALFINKVVQTFNYFCHEIICINIDLGVDVQRYQGFRENQRLFIGRDSIEKNRGYL
jgi:hypothetical protein